jgi:hypothetical protein
MIKFYVPKGVTRQSVCVDLEPQFLLKGMREEDGFIEKVELWQQTGELIVLAKNTNIEDVEIFN